MVAGIHDRRRKDVAEWIRLGVEAGKLDMRLSEDAVAGQFGASIVGIVYHWLQHLDDIDGVASLHENLKHSMGLALGVA